MFCKSNLYRFKQLVHMIGLSGCSLLSFGCNPLNTIVPWDRPSLKTYCLAKFNPRYGYYQLQSDYALSQFIESFSVPLVDGQHAGEALKQYRNVEAFFRKSPFLVMRMHYPKIVEQLNSDELKYFYVIQSDNDISKKIKTGTLDIDWIKREIKRMQATKIRHIPSIVPDLCTIMVNKYARQCLFQLDYKRLEDEPWLSLFESSIFANPWGALSTVGDIHLVESVLNHCMGQLDWYRSRIEKYSSEGNSGSYSRAKDDYDAYAKQLGAALIRFLCMAMNNYNHRGQIIKLVLEQVGYLDDMNRHLDIYAAQSWSMIALDEVLAKGQYGNDPAYLSLVSLLLRRVDVNMQDANGKTALHKVSAMPYFVRSSNTSPYGPGKGRMRFLLRYGANPNIQDFDGCTPLHILVKTADLSESCIELLLRHKCNPNIQDNNGDTALHLAVSCDRPSSLAYLCRIPARVDIKNNKGETPLDVAKSRGVRKLIELLNTYIAYLSQIQLVVAR
ncbi:Ankyrin repeats containing protein [Cardinium endosymbiont of Sogatella furcifera]|uniref:ankyrin repeat domain-containing protein n=1 Tax=Cardinium endosymbiont of Sogatella furcifera TaxID=650378 RepID=UPI000E0D05FC|nr:ankyrin repeat domain-containing protein [Cardinium endosymbiont of Sogatella furcifera]AXI24608.1 Ankyrin repeats containing protein [Cardinium endosymbiont of Sogatella furcifera]